MDSDDEVDIFDTRIDDIWKENMEVYEKEFNFKVCDDEEEEKGEDDARVKEDDKVKEDEKVKSRKDSSLEKDQKSIEKNEDEDCILGSKAIELLREIAARKQARRGRRKGSKRKVANTTNTEDIYEGIKLTASAKRRIREVELETARDARRIEEENKLIFAKCDNINNLDSPGEQKIIEDINRQISIKIRYQFKVSKVKVQEKEEFKFIFQKIADLYGIEPTKFLLCLGDNTIKINDTPESLNIRICDIIDCIPYDDEEGNTKSSHNLLLKIQSNDTRKKIEIRAHKLEKFLEVMKRYAEVRKLPLESMTFEFDGELIQPDETPSDLDMESGSCIDVRVSNADKPSSKQAPPSNAKNIPPIPMLNLIQLD